MKRLLSLTLMMVLASASTASFAIDFGRCRGWQSKYYIPPECTIPLGPVFTRPATPPMVRGVQWRLKEIEDYGKKKMECAGEITATMNKLFKTSGSLTVTMDSGSIDATLASDYPQKCADVHVCDKNGEVVPFNPADPNFSQTPPPYSYGKWTCSKDVVYNIDGTNYLNYKVSAP